MADNTARRLPPPYKHGGAGHTLSKITLPSPNGFGENGRVNGEQRHWGGGDITVATSLRLLLGGAEELTRPLEENEWLYACAKAKAAAVASVRLVLWQSDEDEADEVAEGDPVAKLFAQPNRITSTSQLLEAGVYHRIDSGEDFWFLADKDGKPTANNDKGIIDLPAQIVQVSGRRVEIDDFDEAGFPKTWSYAAAKGARVKFPAAAVLPFLNFDPYNRFRGLGAADVLARALGVYFQAQRYQEGILREGGDPGGFVEIDSNAGAKEVEKEQARVDDEFGNPRNRGRWKVIAGAKYIPNVLAPKDMEYGALLKWVREAIASVTGVPLPAIGILDDATLANLDASLRAMWTGANGVLVYLNSVAAVLNAHFFPRLREARFQKYRVGWDLSEIEALREDNTTKITAAGALARQGVGASFNEALVLYGVEVDPLPNGDAQVDPFGGLGQGDTGEGGPASDAPSATDNGAPTAAGNAATATGNDVQSIFLNGAQMAQLVDIVAQVTAGTLPRDSGLAMVEMLFGLTTAQAARLIGTAGTPKPTTPNPNPNAQQDPNAPGAGPRDPEEDEPEDVPEEDMPDDEMGEEMSAPVSVTRGNPPLDTKEARLAYAQGVEKRVMSIGDASIFKAARAFLRKYELAQRKRIEAFARDGIAGRKFAAEAKRLGLTRDPFAESQLEILLLNRAEWEKKMAELLGQPLRSVTEVALQDMASELGAVSVGVQDPRVVQALYEQSIKLVEGVNSTLAKQVKTALMEVFAENSTVGDLQLAVKDLLPELDERLKQVFASRDQRAQTIARTESASATNSARDIEMHEEGVTQTQWVTAGDDAVRESHEALDGEIRPIGQPYAPGLSRPHDPNAPASEVINCFIPDTLVSGAMVSGLEARYAGPVWEIETARGKRLTTTPNHPVLTGDGWKRASAIGEGDYLIGAQPNVGLGMVRDVHDEDGPSRIEDVFKALAANRGVRARMVVALDLHGDGAFGNGEVHVVNADRELWLDRAAKAFQSGSDVSLLLPDAHGAAALRDSAHALSRDRVGGTATRSPRPGDLALDRSSVQLERAPLGALRIGPAANWNVHVSEQAKERGARDPQFISDLFEASAGLVTVDKVIAVRERHFDGHVYDLQSATGWILAEDIICGNCRCVLNALD